MRGSTKYFYGRDHLGSVREVVDESTGNVVARFDYDPYGRREQTLGAGTFDVDWGFTGHYFHAASGLHLAPFRAYSADLGRWLSRDPIGEAGGVTRYSYVDNNPINYFDPDGFAKVPWNPSTWADSNGAPWYTRDAWTTGGPGQGQAFQQGAYDGYIGWSNGFLNSLSFGFLKDYSDKTNCDQQFSSLWGSVTAISLTTALGSAIGGAFVPKTGTELHHWLIPNRWKRIPSFIRNARWNLNPLTITQHALADKSRYRFMPKVWKALNPLPDPLTRFLNGIPLRLKGGMFGLGGSTFEDTTSTCNDERP